MKLKSEKKLLKRIIWIPVDVIFVKSTNKTAYLKYITTYTTYYSTILYLIRDSSQLEKKLGKQWAPVIIGPQ